MNETGPNLVTTYAFKGKEYIVKMKVTASKVCQRSMELTVTDKYTAEDWRSSYDAMYVENLTHKTGNYKPFEVFTAMLQSGLLKTSECITLDLLTFEDLELLRARRTENASYSSLNNNANNRRYFIVTYTVEFDRIHYPLPLDYYGLPDPRVLQTTIRRLQAEIDRLQSTGLNKDLQRRIEQLVLANKMLVEENHRLSNGGKGIKHLLGKIKSLENSVAKERASFQVQIQKLCAENKALTLKLQQFNEISKRRPGDGSPALKRRTPTASSHSRCSNRRRSRSRSPTIFGHFKTSCLSPNVTNSRLGLNCSGNTLDSFRSRDSFHPIVSKSTYITRKNSKLDLENLESKIHLLQKMLKDGINLN